MKTRWLMLSIPFDGSIGAPSSSGARCFGGLISGRRSTPLGAAEGSGGNAPSGHVGTSSDAAWLALGVCVGALALVSVPGDPVVQATAIAPTSANAATDRVSPRGR